MFQMSRRQNKVIISYDLLMNIYKKLYDIYLTEGFLSLFCLWDDEQVKLQKIII
jgi:hypothetical protein